MRISIVTSLYNSSKFVRVFYEEYSKILIKNQISYEFIFVDDGSPDNSSSIVIDICKDAPKIVWGKKGDIRPEINELINCYDWVIRKIE